MAAATDFSSASGEFTAGSFCGFCRCEWTSRQASWTQTGANLHSKALNSEPRRLQPNPPVLSLAFNGFRVLGFRDFEA